MIIHEFYLDMVHGERKTEIFLSQYDDDFKLKINLVAWCGDFSMPSGTTAALRGTKSDGNGFITNCVIDGTTVMVDGNKQMTAVAGKSAFELTLYNNDKELNSATFIVNVKRAALDQDTLTNDSEIRELSKIQELIDVNKRADELIDAAREIDSTKQTVENLANSAKSAANSASQSANTATNNAQMATQAANTATQKAEQVANLVESVGDLSGVVRESQKGQAGGVASLDSSGKLLKSQLPSVTKSDVGLGNVENKSSATIRGEITKKNVTDALGYTPIQSQYTHPIGQGYEHLPSGGSNGQALKRNGNGDAVWDDMPKIAMGRASVNITEANKPSYVDVVFPSGTFTDTPRVVATPVTSVPGTSILGVGVSEISKTGFTLYVTRANTASTSVDWIAIGS